MNRQKVDDAMHFILGLVSGFIIYLALSPFITWLP